MQDCEEPWPFLCMLTLCNKFLCEVLSECWAPYKQCVKADKECVHQHAFLDCDVKFSVMPVSVAQYADTREIQRYLVVKNDTIPEYRYFKNNIGF